MWFLLFLLMVMLFLVLQQLLDSWLFAFAGVLAILVALGLGVRLYYLFAVGCPPGFVYIFRDGVCVRGFNP